MDKIILPTQEQVNKIMQQAAAAPVLKSYPVGSRVGPTIVIQNLSTVVSDVAVRNAVAALQIQLDRDWLPQWGTTANLLFYTRTQTIPANYWPLYIQDTADISGALGYHTETASGRPFGRVFVKTAAQYGYNWTVTLSHELLEMMADPFVNLTVFSQTSNKTGKLYAFEVCDAVEADAYGYLINGVLVSDFVYPSWFDPYQRAPGTKYDQMNRVRVPFQILPGGYMPVFNITNSSGWVMITHNNMETTEPSLSDRNRWWRD